MVCVSCEAEIESITERVSVMKDRKEEVDLLLEQNASGRLAKVDWNGLNAAISTRLDEADRSKAAVRRYPAAFKIAAGIAAAAVVFIAVIIGTDKQADVQLDSGRRAVVKFIDGKGSASIEIKDTGVESQVMVDIGSGGRRVAMCDVEIIDLNGELKRDKQAAWIIISRPEPMFADNGVNRDMSDMICLF